MWTGKAVDKISLIQNEDKIDNKKTTITFLSDDFSAPCEN